MVASDVGGLSELIPNNQYGWLVTGSRELEWISALEDAMSSKSAASQKAIRAYDRAETLYSFGTIVERWKSLIASRNLKT